MITTRRKLYLICYIKDYYLPSLKCKAVTIDGMKLVLFELAVCLYLGSPRWNKKIK